MVKIYISVYTKFTRLARDSGSDLRRGHQRYARNSPFVIAVYIRTGPLAKHKFRLR